MSSAPTITVTRDFQEQPDQVFNAWLDPVVLSRWMFGPAVRDEEIVHLQADQRPGGRFSFAVRRSGQLIDHVGQYLTIDRPQHLAFTWGVAGQSTSKVAITFMPTPEGTHLSLSHTLDPAWADFTERTRAGWASMLDTLQHVLSPAEGYARITAPHTVQLERVLPGPIERVWDYLTDPVKRGHWLASGPMEPHVGGAVELRFKHASLSPHAAPTPARYRSMDAGHTVKGRVTRYQVPRVLAFTWGDEGAERSEVTFELTPLDTLVQLSIKHRLTDDAETASVAGGWHTHAAILIACLNGEVPPSFWSMHEEYEAAYNQRFEAS